MNPQLKAPSTLSAATLISTAATAAAPVCEPKCPQGQVCAWAASGNGATVCKTPIIISCPNDGPLCGADSHKRKGPGSYQINTTHRPALTASPR